MKQYISKSALVTRIKKLKMDIGNIFNEYDEGFWEGRTTAFDDVICALDTLEVKEGNDSEKDEDYVNDLIGFFYQNNKLKNTKTDIIDWLKSLKDREQPQGIEYYDPYKAVVESIAEMCVRYDKANHSSLEDFYDNVKVKCKDAKEYESLFPREQWKPSDEQMKVFEHFVRSIGESGYASPYENNTKLLYSLLNDLKKLKGE